MAARTRDEGAVGGDRGEAGSDGPADVGVDPGADPAAGPGADDARLLDATDRRILRALLEDARISNVELARRVGLSAPPCLRRVRRLEDSGILRGYGAELDGALVGWPITFFALVGLESQKNTALSAFEREVAAWAEIRECHMIRGGGDFLLRVVARDHAHENRITERLIGLDTVARVQTLQTIRTAHRARGVPL